MRLPRFRVRTLMLAVAVVALLVAGISAGLRLHRLSGYYRAKAVDAGLRGYIESAPGAQWEWMVREYEKDRKIFENSKLPVELREEHERGLIEARVYRDRYRNVAKHYERLRLKYERAARRPWLPIEPDPPAPK